MSIKDINLNERPREKLLIQGAENLSDIELLAIVIGSGVKGNSALDIAYDLYKNRGLSKLVKTPFREFKKIEGIKEIKAIKLAATFELSRRILSSFQISELNEINTDYIVKKYSPFCFGLEREIMGIVILDKDKKIIGETVLYKGNKSMIKTIPKEIYSSIAKYDGKYFYLYHNHPENTKKPSNMDIAFTEELIKGSRSLGFYMLDHIIFTDMGYFSLAEDKYHAYNQ